MTPAIPDQAQKVNPQPQQAVIQSSPAKQGYKTTEFYILLLAVVGQIAGIHTGKIPGATGAISISWTTAAYIAARVFLKWLVSAHPGAMPVLARIETAAEKAAPIAEAILKSAAENPESSIEAHAMPPPPPGNVIPFPAPEK